MHGNVARRSLKSVYKRQSCVNANWLQYLQGKLQQVPRQLMKIALFRGSMPCIQFLETLHPLSSQHWTGILQNPLPMKPIQHFPGMGSFPRHSLSLSNIRAAIYSKDLIVLEYFIANYAKNQFLIQTTLISYSYFKQNTLSLVWCFFRRKKKPSPFRLVKTLL